MGARALRVKELTIDGAQGSRFTGSFWTYCGIKAASWVIGVATFSIGSAWTKCWLYRWIAENTYLDGKRTRFDGDPKKLWLTLFAWNFLTFITLGLYGLKRDLTLEKFRIAHTHFERDDGVLSKPNLHVMQKRLPLVGLLERRQTVFKGDRQLYGGRL